MMPNRPSSVVVQPNRPGRVYAAEGEDRRLAVVIEHPRHEIERDVAVARQLDERGEERPDPLAHRCRRPEPAARRVRGQQEQGDDEHREPQARQRPDQPVVFVGRLVETQERRLGQAEPQQNDDQGNQAADVAEAPAEAGQHSDAPVRNQARKHGVVEDDGELDADGGDDDHYHGEREYVRVRRRGGIPQEKRRGDADGGEDPDPGLAPAAGVGDGAQERRHQRDDDACCGLGITPQRLALHRVADHEGGEIGREDEGRDEGEEGLIGPIEHRPAELAALRGLAQDRHPFHPPVSGVPRCVLINHRTAYGHIADLWKPRHGGAVMGRRGHSLSIDYERNDVQLRERKVTY